MFLIAVLSVFMPINTAFAASGTPLSSNATNGSAVLSVDVYNCSGYVTDESTTAKINQGLNQCVSKVRAGQANNYKLNNL